ncbi:class I SAM-dependent methyltransferase [Gammaproteobacteria bacterium AB-CW1]|uniref:Class I SAM-dependent methyltransferase n=1 Tax=Natronospira elongata TaxID=3110268 RepID=A0AAP6JF01_9GAMM|nr:class I SAM-dependent methyltransferase [Gammaproteobacteria bacterium AB-CW1]
MSNRTTPLDPRLHEYLLGVSLREPAPMRALREETARLPEHNMQIAPEQGQFMQMLLRLMGARRCIEIGTFTGYSTLAMALALPEDGRVLACDLSREWTDVGRGHWRQAGVEERIDLRLGPALETLTGLLEDEEEGRAIWDFAFIDADKTAYGDYFECCLRLLRPGGLIAVDNTLWDGKVADPAVDDADTRAIRQFNESLLADDRVDISLVPIGDGLTLARKRQ